MLPSENNTKTEHPFGRSRHTLSRYHHIQHEQGAFKEVELAKRIARFTRS